MKPSNKNIDQKPKKEWLKKWFSEGISNTLFLSIYNDHINWCLHEDAPWKDTIKTEIDQTLDEYKIKGVPQLILDIFNENDMIEINNVITKGINRKT